MSPGCPLGRCPGHVQLGRGLGKDLGQAGGTICLSAGLESLGITQKSWRNCVWSGISGHLLSDCCLRSPSSDKPAENGQMECLKPGPRVVRLQTRLHSYALSTSFQRRLRHSANFVYVWYNQPTLERISL